MAEPQEAQFDRLGDAMRIYLEHRASGSPESDEELLARHAELRELLQPLLAQDRAAVKDVRAGLIMGDYRLVEPIGRGGMGEVWAAEQISLRRPVALKLLRGNRFASPISLERFRREAFAGARLKHPCVVAVYAVGEHDGMHFIVQELVESRRTLASLLAELRETAVVHADYWRETAERFARIAEALQVAHDAGVVHRDLKPSNILIASDGTPKIADFGMALVDGGMELSRSGELGGSPFYMSPEQAASRRIEIDHRTDIFSLGATLYESLTLARAFDGDTVSQVLKKILVEDPVDPRQIRSRCPRDLAVICMKMMEKERAHRYASMGDIAAELRRFLDHRPIVGRPPGAAARATKWCRRNPALAASGSIGAAALIVVSLLLVETLRARDAADRAHKAAAASADKALAEASAARREADISKGVTNYLVDIFQVPLPENARGQDVTAGDILDKARRDMEHQLQLPEQKAVRARLLLALSNVYLELQMFDEAGPLVTEGTALVEALYKPEEPPYWEALDIQRDWAMGQRDFKKGQVLAEQRYQLIVAARGAEDPMSYHALYQVGGALQRQGAYSEAETKITEAVEGLRRTAGDDDPRTAEAVKFLGHMLHLMGRLGEAKELLQLALGSFERISGSDHPNCIEIISDLAIIAQQQGERAEAERLSREAVSITTCVCGPRHRQTLDTRRNLAIVLAQQGRFSESKDECLEILGLAREPDGRLRETGVFVLGTLAPVYRELGLLQDAAETYALAIDQYSRHFGAESAMTLKLFLGLALTCGMMGDDESFESLNREALENLTRIYGPTNPDRLLALQNVVAMLRKQHRFEEALPLAEELVDDTPQGHPEDGARRKLLRQVHDALDEARPIEASAIR